jgi:hypothetical protein
MLILVAGNPVIIIQNLNIHNPFILRTFVELNYYNFEF